MNLLTHQKSLYLVSFLLSFCSLLYELLLAQSISFYTGNVVILYSLVIGIFLLFMGIGASLSGIIFKDRDVYASLWLVEILLCVIGGLSVFIVNYSFIFTYLGAKQHPWIGVAYFYGLNILTILSIGLLSGFELPLLFRIGKKIDGSGRLVNKILSADYFGALCAGFAFPLVLLPNFSLITIALLIAFINLLVAMNFKNMLGIKKKGSRNNIAYLLLVMIVVGLINAEGITQYFLKKYYYYQSTESSKEIFDIQEDLPEIQRYSSKYQHIDVVRLPASFDAFLAAFVNLYSNKERSQDDYNEGRVLFLNGAWQFSSNFEEFYHEYFAHVPIIANGEIPKKILVVGAGDGLLLAELLKYKEVKSVDLVELDHSMIDLFSTDDYFKNLNKNALNDKRVKVHVADGFQYLRNNKNQYDAIFMDLPVAKDYNLNKLYSREFYAFIHRSLSAKGFAVLDVDLFDPFDDDGDYVDAALTLETFIHTLASSGFSNIWPFYINLENEEGVIGDFARSYISQISGRPIENIDRESAQYIVEIENERLDIKEDFEKYLSIFQQGYIMVNKDPKRIRNNQLFDIQYNVLNSDRYNKSFQLPFTPQLQFNSQRINSIMRPTLTIEHFKYWVKLPY